jgi:hypothetical protein
VAEVPKNPLSGTPPISPLTGGNGYTLSASTAADMLSRIGIPPPSATSSLRPATPTIGPAPEKTLIGEIKSAYLSSHTPLQFIDKARRNITNLGMENLRGNVSAPVDKSLTSTFIDAAKAITYVVSADFMRPGDKRFSQDIAASLEASLDKNGKPMQFGEYDIMMAAGWQPKGPIKVNGVLKTLDKPIDNMLSVFVRNKDGEIEILEPSQKMTSLTEIGRLWSAVMSEPKNDTDKRWQETAGKHVAWQVLPMVASGGTWATLKGGTMAATKIPQLEKITEIGMKASGAATKIALPLAVTNGISGLSMMAGELNQGFIISPKAVKDLADGVANILNNPKSITEDGVRDKINNALHEYSFNKGPDAQQIYIPSLSKQDRPWERLQYALQGIVSAHEKQNHPWEKWSLVPRRGEVSDIREALVEHPGVKSAFFKSTEKFLSGERLTDQDIFTMRVGINLGPVMSENMTPAGKNGLNFTPDEERETLRVLGDQLQWRILERLKGGAPESPEEKEAESYARKLGINRDDIDPGNPQFTPAQIKTFVSDQAKTYGGIVDAELKAQTQQNTARVTALGMGL